MTHASELTEILFLACSFRHAGILRDKLDSGGRRANFAIAIIPAGAGSFAQRMRQSDTRRRAGSLAAAQGDLIICQPESIGRTE